MRGPHNILALIRTGATFERNGAMAVVLNELNAPGYLKVAIRVLSWPFHFLARSGNPSLPPVARSLSAMGPAYIKFGQILSTRPDVVGSEIASQLRVLQDRLPPFPTEIAKQSFAHEIGTDADEIFTEFSDSVAAASIAQVHKARLRGTGQEVAVKVLRPRIERAFRRDIDAFYFVAGLVQRLAPGARRLRPVEVIAHFESVVMKELDLRMEASAGDEFRTTTADDPGFTVPAVHWPLSGRRAMVLDWAEGVPIGDVEALRAAGQDLAGLGSRVLQIFLRTALRDGYFHADMHQGNLKVAENGDLIALDYGIMGRIDEYTRRVYAEILMGFIRKDYRRVAEVHFEAGYVPADRDIDAFAQALRSVGEPIFGMDATQISMARLLAYLFEVTERFGMETRTELILLQRTMVVVEGVARSLHPSINIWEVAGPVVEDYIRRNVGPRALARDLRATALVLARFGPRLPRLVETAIMAQMDPPEPELPARRGHPLFFTLLGAGLAAAALTFWQGL
ncbi:2-polyprenylphenol 6-hydroxylase [Maritimibacter sp. 55A14]|uniref:2-polyprenylphenol 6-hydroxylase n=1 Tax=Maritimibacter sp. 55A14 TaxID=2174844 RepID=UPI000D61157E|nr:2-polyprenylphenol 6-hydroxylase [Maritimibacter sp. 55A14]PWE32375.1 2-polyprenylphenol 6-hydroxylase [Maritimibacter sp. 55A14]